MVKPRKGRRLVDHPAMDRAVFTLGVTLIVLSPFVGAIPGPGGLIVVGIGLGLVLKTSIRARRHYVRFKRWQPKAGKWADMALRRSSSQRRQSIIQEQSTKARQV